MKIDMQFTGSNITTAFSGSLNIESREELNDPFSIFQKNISEKVIHWFSPPKVEKLSVTVMDHEYRLKNPSKNDIISAAKCINTESENNLTNCLRNLGFH
jgi:hypothetical protein